MASTPASTLAPPAPREPRPDLDPKPKGRFEQALTLVYVAVPFLALLAAVPFAWGWGLTWLDIAIGAVMYVITGLGVTVGYHRHFTHGSFKAKRPLRIALAIAGSLSIEGDVVFWVAEHRRHHKYADQEGDPHSPWRFGEDWKALTKGLVYAHVGWLLGGERTSQRRFAPDLLADGAIRRISRTFLLWAGVSLLLPPLIGGLVTMSWWGALTAFFWASLVRLALLHHVTWSINSVCHTFGTEQFEVRDKSRNVWWLAVLSFGESWHNLHHADPTCARHGALKGQVDASARVIWLFEKLGWAYAVRWPDERRLAARRVGVSP